MHALVTASPARSALPDLLSGYSFEICARDAVRLAAIRPLVPAGTMVSITNLPNETDAARIAAAAEVRRLGLEPMPHLAARRIASRAALDRLLDGLAREAAVTRLFVIAGDLAAPAGSFADSLALIEALPDGFGTIGVAGYPEGHPAIAGNALDHALIDKARVVAAQGRALEVMTQFAFDAEPIVAWAVRVRAQSIEGRLRLGLPGPASVATLLKFAARCGVGASAKVMANYGASITRLMNTAGPDRLYAELQQGLDPATHGPVGVHLYPFGGLDRMARWAADHAIQERPA
jgi:methylenetetrahydrofolate reductase (NADPH)